MNAKPDHELGATRRKELAASCEILGIDRWIVLDYADGQLHRVDLQKVVGDLVRHVREFRPHIVLTFGPEGAVTGHTDHTMASVFATLAYEWAGRNNRYADQLMDGLTPHRAQKLYYATANFVLPDRAPTSPPPSTTTIEIGERVKTKVDAFAEQRHQAPVFPLVRDRFYLVGRGGVSSAAMSKPGIVGVETDLLDGIEE